MVGIPNPQRPGSEVLITVAPGYAGAAEEEALKADIMEMADQKLSPYEVPKMLEIRKELPLTAVGKVDKKVLRAEARTQR
jgi:acyl-CoA synthetase (AMP-forming)/AMP-acid ligase II